MDIKIIKHDINKFSSQKIRLKLEDDILKKNKNLFPVKVYSFFSKIAQIIFGCKSISQHNLEYSLKYANSLVKEKKNSFVASDISSANLEIKNIENTFKDYLNTNKGKNDKKRLEDLKYKLSILNNKLEFNQEDSLNLETTNDFTENVNIFSKNESLDDEKDATDKDEIMPNLPIGFLETNTDASASSKEDNTPSNIILITEDTYNETQTVPTEFTHVNDIIENLFAQQNNFGIDFIVELQCFFSLIFNKNVKLKARDPYIENHFRQKLNKLQKVFLSIKEIKELNKMVLKKIVKLWIENQEIIRKSLNEKNNLSVYNIVNENIKNLQNEIKVDSHSWNSLTHHYKAIINSQRIQKITNIRFSI